MRLYIQQFSDYLTIQRGYSNRTIKAYEYDLIKFSEFLLQKKKNSRIKKITRQDIFDYLAHLSLTNLDKKPVSVVTRARKLASIRSFFNYLSDFELIKKNPVRQINLPHIPQKEPDYLTVKEYQKLLKVVEATATPFFKNRDLALITLFLATGIRVSEMVDLQLNNIDLVSGTIKVRRKGDKEQTIPLNKVASRVLSHYFQTRSDSDDNSVFLSKLGTGIRPNSVFSLIKKYLIRAGIKKSKQGPHLLRHTAFTALLSKDVNPVIIQSLAGHASFDTTRRYLHINDRQVKQAVEQIDFERSL